MKFKNLYERIIKTGIENDPRGVDLVNKQLKELKEDYKYLKERDKYFFDKEDLVNPYPDTRVLYNIDPEKEISRIMVGIDIETPELLLSREFEPDVVLSHHPEGGAYANMHKVMGMQSDIQKIHGIPISAAENLIEEGADEARRDVLGYNFMRPVDAAKLLDLSFMCAHTPADNMVHTFLTKLFEERKPDKLSDIINVLLGIEEYKNGMKHGDGPYISLGEEKRTAGKIFVDMTGGSSSSEDIYDSFGYGGINTIVTMHMSSEHREKCEENHINVILAGHYSSDSLGMSLLLNNIIPRHVEVIPFSGYFMSRKFKER